jgi:hypothetical protein
MKKDWVGGSRRRFCSPWSKGGSGSSRRGAGDGERRRCLEEEQTAAAGRVWGERS